MDRRPDAVAAAAISVALAGCHGSSKEQASQEAGAAALVPVNMTPLPAASVAAYVNPAHLPAYTGPTGTQADKAVAFAYAQLGKPYVYGATGPSSYDCSGLVQAAWAAAGVAIPRTTFEDWDDLPHIPVSAMVPGDLIIYDGEGHVAIYVGDGYIIDAPHTGAYVERVPYDESWYVDNEDGVLQP